MSHDTCDGFMSHDLVCKIGVRLTSRRDLDDREEFDFGIYIFMYICINICVYIYVCICI